MFEIGAAAALGTADPDEGAVPPRSGSKLAGGQWSDLPSPFSSMEPITEVPTIRDFTASAIRPKTTLSMVSVGWW